MRKTLVLAMVVACGGDKNSSGPIAIDDLFPQYLDALCTFEANCAQEPDKATCVADDNIEEADILTLIADVKAGTITYDADAAGACLAAIRNTSCATFAPRAQIADSSELCILTVFGGTVPEGGACNSLFECDSGGSALSVNCESTMSSCDPATTCCPGTCTAEPPTSGSGAVGTTCTTSEDCLATLYCSEVTHACKQPGAAAGDACDATDGCDNPLICTQDAQTSMGTCGPQIATGGTCDPESNFQCGDSRDYCDSTTLTCTRRVAVGQTCTDTTPCVSFRPVLGRDVRRGGQDRRRVRRRLGPAVPAEPSVHRQRVRRDSRRQRLHVAAMDRP